MEGERPKEIVEPIGAREANDTSTPPTIEQPESEEGLISARDQDMLALWQALGPETTQARTAEIKERLEAEYQRQRNDPGFREREERLQQEWAEFLARMRSLGSKD